MKDKSSVIFGNKIDPKVVKKAERTKAKNAKKYGDDSAAEYTAKLQENRTLTEPLGVYDIRVNEGEGEIPFDTEKGVIVGNIRMGFGHYRISIAMASAAHALGYTPYWMDLNSYADTTCTKVIGAQNDLYSLGSRLSQKNKPFNKIVWEPLNYEGFRQLTYNAGDQKNAELMAPVFHSIPKDIPVIGTHVWPAQAAIHADMKYVVNAIPDNWPMALHYAEGALHLVQTHQSYLGYRVLNGIGSIPGIVFGVLICVIAAFPMALLGIIPQSIVADVAEADGIETGENREGMFFAARTFAMKFGQSLAMLVFTSLAIIGTTQNQSSNDITASTLGMTIVGVVAVVFCVLGAIILGFYNEKKIMSTIDKKNK